MRGLGGIGFQCRKHVHPIEGRQLIEVNNMILHGVGRHHHVTDVLCIQRNFQFESVLDRAHRANGMHHSAYSTDALQNSPGIAWITIQHNLFDAAPHLARGPGPCNPAILDFDIDAKVALDTGDWINRNSYRHGDAPTRLPAPAR
jgi:hypothetical protein